MRRWKLIPTHLTALRTVNPYAEADPYAFDCPTHRQPLRGSRSLRVWLPYAPSIPTQKLIPTHLSTLRAISPYAPHLFHWCGFHGHPTASVPLSHFPKALQPQLHIHTCSCRIPPCNELLSRSHMNPPWPASSWLLSSSKWSLWELDDLCWICRYRCSLSAFGLWAFGLWPRSMVILGSQSSILWGHILVVFE